MTEPLYIPRRPRSEVPTEPGFYLVHEAGVNRPQLVKWSGYEKTWRYAKSNAQMPVDGWLGPIHGVPDAFKDAP